MDALVLQGAKAMRGEKKGESKLESCPKVLVHHILTMLLQETTLFTV